MTDAFHDADSLDIAEQLLIQNQAINAQLLRIIATHRANAPRLPIATHDGSIPQCAVSCDEPPSRPV